MGASSVIASAEGVTVLIAPVYVTAIELSIGARLDHVYCSGRCLNDPARLNSDVKLGMCLSVYPKEKRPGPP
jgi:hypothetical protein